MARLFIETKRKTQRRKEKREGRYAEPRKKKNPYALGSRGKKVASQKKISALCKGGGKGGTDVRQPYACRKGGAEVFLILVRGKKDRAPDESERESRSLEA